LLGWNQEETITGDIGVLGKLLHLGLIPTEECSAKFRIIGLQLGASSLCAVVCMCGEREKRERGGREREQTERERDEREKREREGEREERERKKGEERRERETTPCSKCY
jgi:hypothetical protein